MGTTKPLIGRPSLSPDDETAYLAIRIPSSIKDELTREAGARGTTVSAYVRSILTDAAEQSQKADA